MAIIYIEIDLPKRILSEVKMSKFFEWEESLNLHVNDMDIEHKQIVHYMNELYECFEKKSEKSVYEPILKELHQFTIKHFKDEEEFFSKLDYPQAESHKYIHKDLLAKLEQNAKIVSEKGLNEDLFFFLKMWLTAHICGIDMKYAEIANKKAS